MATRATDQDVADAIARSKREILADIDTGRVPASVATFGDLHDYVDANEYGGLCDEGGAFDVGWSEDESSIDDRADEVQSAVHDWLVAGRPDGSPREERILPRIVEDEIVDFDESFGL
jgi:hypothetical protein